MLRAASDVARLTRPARIRCRPLLHLRPKSDIPPSLEWALTETFDKRPAGTLPPWPEAPLRSPGPAAPISRRKPIKGGSEGMEDRKAKINTSRSETADYTTAKELAMFRDKSNSTASSSRISSLPSLRNPSSFRRDGNPPRNDGQAFTTSSSSYQTTIANKHATPRRPRTVTPTTTSQSPASSQISQNAEASSSRRTLPSLSRIANQRTRAQAAQNPAQAASAVPGETLSAMAPAQSDLKGKGKEILPSPPQGLRRNAAGVQLLSPTLHRQLFPGQRLQTPPNQLIQLSKEHLAANGLDAADAARLEEINFDMPPLRGSNIREHFHAIGKQEAEPYLSMAHDFASVDLPPMPESWCTEWSGWTKYHSDGRIEAVDDLGDEEVVSFDVEVLYKLSPYPVIATAATPNAWYSWLCPTIFGKPPEEPLPAKPKWDKALDDRLPHTLVPMFKHQKPSMVIGHNVGYDRARIKDEYTLKPTATRFLDTLSLHVATRGITSVQRPTWIKHRKDKKQRAAEEQGIKEATIQLLRDLNPEYAEILDEMEIQAEREPTSNDDPDSASLGSTWEDVTSVNSLKDVAALHCGYAVDKTVRERFGDDDIKHASQLLSELEELIQYCADDVKVTHDVFKKVFPLFIESCPHPASFAGALSMGSAILPVDQQWNEYIKAAEETYRKMEKEVAKSLRSLAEKLRLEGPRDDDPWTSQLDWTEKKARWPDTGPDAPAAAVDAVSNARAIVNPDRTPELQTHDAPERPVSPAESLPIMKVEPAEPKIDWSERFAPPKLAAGKGIDQRDIPHLLRMTFKGFPVVYRENGGWCFQVPVGETGQFEKAHGAPVSGDDNSALFSLTTTGKKSKQRLTGPGIKPLIKNGLTSPYLELLESASQGDLGTILEAVPALVENLRTLPEDDHDVEQLSRGAISASAKRRASTPRSPSPASSVDSKKSSFGTWPAWYRDLTKPPSHLTPGELDLTQKKSVTALLLRLQWEGYPLFFTRNYKWVYRIPRREIPLDDWNNNGTVKGHGAPMAWNEQSLPGDESFAADNLKYAFFRLPHPGGDGKNVGSPLAKTFVKYLENGRLSSASIGDDHASAAIARDATQISVLCSYWVSARERIMDQMVVYGSPNSGLILPQVITMGTVTRRAVESTWLTASNAKKNRVGSELKAMVKAPPGYSIVGADVDSEELWISSVMGDSQFGMHGATAIGWMTLEGTKSAGTDLHSKTASILGTSRDAAKVFNYSRIYGAGVKHAVQLLMQGDATLTKEQATEKAKALYAATKGEKSSRSRRLPPAPQTTLWHGGSESFLFNTLEAIALSDRPTTPALGCGVTKALSRSYLDELNTYLPSRINWVVQSSGVDYLHLLIISMSYLIKRYNIQARYMLSVHDEVRYLAKEEDKYRTALALQIANAWTRALFCYNLGIDDVPQGVTFFSSVDIDLVLRKEVNMPCITPSHPDAIPFGESLDIDQLLLKTDNGTLGSTTSYEAPMIDMANTGPPVSIVQDMDSFAHFQFLKAQAERQGYRARVWLDRQYSVDGQPPPEDVPGPATAKRGRAKGAKMERLRDATSHLGESPDAKEIMDALVVFEAETRRK